MAKQKTINIVYKVNKKEIDSATASTKKIQGETQKLKKELKETESVGTKAFNAIGAAILAVGIGSLVKDILKLGAAQQQLNIAFTTFLGDANKAKKLIAELTKFSIVTPFTPEQVNKAAKSLLAFGVQGKDIIKTLKMLGDVSAGTGKDLAEMAIIFGQIRSTGRLMGQDLLQLINAGFNPLQVISEKTGKSVASLKKEMEEGLITFDDVSEAFKTATSEGGLFFNLMEKQSASIAGKWSTIMGNIEEVGKGIFENNIFLIDTIVTKLGQFTAAFNEIITLANSDPTFDRAQRIVEAYTTSVDEAGNSTDLLDESIKKIKDSGNSDDANKLYMKLTEAINAYQLQVEIARKSVEKNSRFDNIWRGKEIQAEKEKWESILESNKKAVDMLIATREKLGKSIIDASSTFEPPKIFDIPNEKDIEVDIAKVWENVWTNTKTLIKDKNEILSNDAKVGVDLVGAALNAKHNLLVRANEAELKEVEEHNKKLKELEKQKADYKKEVQRELFNMGVDLLGQALNATIDSNTAEADAIKAGYDRQIEAAGDNERAKNELRIKAAEAEREGAKRQAEETKKRQIKEMLIQTLLNAVRALASWWYGSPAPNFPAAGRATAYGLASVAIAQATGFKEGIIDLQGAGTATSDSIPARLSRGESVMTAEETRKSMGILKDIRAKKLDDKIFENLKVTGGSVVANLDDRRIVSAIEKSQINLSREGSTLYEHRRISETLTRRIRAKIITR